MFLGGDYMLKLIFFVLDINMDCLVCLLKISPIAWLADWGHETLIPKTRELSVVCKFYNLICLA